MKVQWHVTTGRELVKSPEDLALLEFAELPFFIARPFAAPPEIPAERAKALQDAFTRMTRDPADAEKLALDNTPIDGEAGRELIVKLAATPQDLVQRYNQIVCGF